MKILIHLYYAAEYIQSHIFQTSVVLQLGFISIEATQHTDRRIQGNGYDVMCDVCDDLYNGAGIANFVAWYRNYYDVPATRNEVLSA